MGSMTGSSVPTSGYNSVSVSPSPATTPAMSGVLSDTNSTNVSPVKGKRKLVASTNATRRQGSEGPPPKTAVSKFFDRDKSKKSQSTPTSPVDWNRVRASKKLFFSYYSRNILANNCLQVNDENDRSTLEVSRKKPPLAQD
jgi:hypothetical protein